VNTRKIDLGRHSKQCSVCNHEKRDEIEREFIAWRSPAAIAGDYGLSDRATVYRHAHALDLFEKRQRNVRAALERIIEQAGEVSVNASAVVAAIQAYAKINSLGRWIERSEHLNLNELFARMSADELEAYAKDGKLPEWFVSAAGSGGADSEALKVGDIEAAEDSEGSSTSTATDVLRDP